METAPDWIDLAEGIRRNDSAAVDKFCAIFTGGIRHCLKGQLGDEDLEDNVRECLAVLIDAIRNTKTGAPEGFVGLVNTAVKRHIAHQIAGRASEELQRGVGDAAVCFSLKAPSPTFLHEKDERRRIASLVLDGLCERDREVLRRFYLLSESSERICDEMNIGEEVFWRIKNEARKKFIARYQGTSKRRNHRTPGGGDTPHPQAG